MYHTTDRIHATIPMPLSRVRALWWWCVSDLAQEPEGADFRYNNQHGWILGRINEQESTRVAAGQPTPARTKEILTNVVTQEPFGSDWWTLQTHDFRIFETQLSRYSEGHLLLLAESGDSCDQPQYQKSDRSPSKICDPAKNNDWTWHFANHSFKTVFRMSTQIDIHYSWPQSTSTSLKTRSVPSV
jgi:hypothetical protein